MTWKQFKDEWLHILFGIDPVEVIGQGEKRMVTRLVAERKEPKRKANWRRPEEIVIPVKHIKTYAFGITENGQINTPCKTCGQRDAVFSDSVDAAGNPVRFCFHCLKRYGGFEELTRAVQKSKYAKRWVECREAYEKLCRLFPDVNRRPLGTKTLLSEMEMPFSTGKNAESIIAKIQNERWTQYDEEVIQDGLGIAEKRWSEKQN